MRSFAGVLHDDGSSPDPRLLQTLASVLRLDGSSEPLMQIEGACGLASVTHRGGTARIARRGSVSLAGDIRLDGGTGRDADEIVLDALQHGEGIAQLSGDFSFALWDRSSQTLHCARDRFGVRPFFYARFERGLVFSDSLEAVLAHPGVNALELDDLAVADYLTSAVCLDAEATVYAQVRRLAPAHQMTVHSGETEIRRYWTLRMPNTRHDNPAARFESALRSAVADRVTASSAVAFMSGGLDSTALTAFAREARPETNILAITSVYRTRMRDVEESFAIEAARSIGVPIHCVPLDDYAPLQSVDEGLWTADPGALLTAKMTRDLYAMAAEHAPVALHGHPADAVLAADLTRVLLDSGLLSRLAALIRYTIARRRPPYFFLRELLENRAPSSVPPPGPDWLLVKPRVKPRTLAVEESVPVAIRALQSPAWSSYFEWAHPLQTRAPIALAYPWCDPRVIETALSMEPIPWLADKHVLRTILRGRVSEAIRKRRKTYLQGDPWTVSGNGRGFEIQAASRYIDPVRFRQRCERDGELADMTLRAVAFDYWLKELPNRVTVLRTRGAGRALG